MSARGKILSVHRFLGIALGFYFALMALSGAYLVYSDTVEVWLAPGRYISEKETKTFDLEKVVTAAQEGIRTPIVPSRVKIPEDPKRNIILTFRLPRMGEEPVRKIVYVDPSNYRAKDSHDFREDLTGFIFRFHEEFMVGKKVGRPVVAGAGIGFIFILFSGLFLWWPNRKQLKRVLSWPRLRAFYPAMFQLHKFFGFYSLPLLLMLSVSGVYIAKPEWFEQGEKEEKPKEEKEKPEAVLDKNGPLSFTDLQAKLSAHRIALRPLSLSIDAEGMLVKLRIPSSEKRYQLTLQDGLFQALPEEKEKEEFSLHGFMHDIHAGKFWSWYGRVLVFLAMPFVLFLSSTGYYLYTKRVSRTRA